jgi:glycosidase
MTVGELPYTPKVDDVLKYISAKERQLNMIFNFETLNLGQTVGARFKVIPFSPIDFKTEITRWQSITEGTDAWTTTFLENHDQGERHIFY